MLKITANAQEWPSQWEANLLAEFAALKADLFYLV